jgi:hypothetical protein
MLNDPDRDVRYQAGTSLLNILEPTKISKLAVALRTGVPVHRCEAAHTLGRMGHGAFGDASSAVEELMAALADPYENVRVCAAHALVRIEATKPRVLETIATCLNSDRPFVVYMAMEGLIEERSGWRKEFFDRHRPASMVAASCIFLNTTKITNTGHWLPLYYLTVKIHPTVSLQL